jgi:hypothetical protein
MRLATLPLFAALAITIAAPLAAQMGHEPGRHSRNANRHLPRTDAREGRVSAEHFAAEGAEALLGHGTITLATTPDSTPESRELLAYEAALIDRLVLAGYNTLTPTPGSPQVAEIRVRQIIEEPAEARRDPVSGEGSVMVSNRGTAVGMAVAVDFTEPRTALVATHMDLRIKDRESGDILWEARAQIATREGDPDWSADAIAAQLSAALFQGFPRGG